MSHDQTAQPADSQPEQSQPKQSSTAELSSLRWRNLSGHVNVIAVFYPCSYTAESISAEPISAQPLSAQKLSRALAEQLWKHWEPGCVIRKLSGLGYVLQWPNLRRMDIEQLDAVPLLAPQPAQQPISNVELIKGSKHNQRFLAQYQTADDGLLLLCAGVLYWRRLSESEPVNPADWIAVGNLQLRPVQHFQPPPVEAQLAAPESKPLREALGGKIPLPDKDAREAAKELFRQAQKDASQPGRALPSRRYNNARDALAAGVASLLMRILSKGGNSYDARNAANGAARGQRTANAMGNGPGPLRRWAERVLFNSQLGRWAGRKQADYMRRLLDQFDRGDLMEALRSAIPLGSNGFADPSNMPAWGTPELRKTLQIETSIGPSRSIGFSDDLYEMLRKKYRQAFDRLDREKRYAEAAFVLAELLHENEEAVAYLEKHGELQQAAEVAESRELKPSLVIRQWMIAGNPKRAMLIAQRYGCHQEAVRQLERGHPKLAQTLRLLWADSAWDAGDKLTAINALWDVTEARAIRARMLEALLDGGPTEAPLEPGLLAKALEEAASFEPELQTQLDDQLQHLLHAHSGLLAEPTHSRSNEADQDTARQALSAAHRRQQFSQALSGMKLQASLQQRLFALPRQLLLDQSAGHSSGSKKALQQLCEQLGQPSLAQNLPKALPQQISSEPLINRRGNAVEQHLDGRGNQPVLDAHRLANGQWLVANGESGATLLNRNGKPKRHFNVPCARLVLADNQCRAIAISERGEAQMLHQLELDSGRSHYWTTTHLDHWADTYDGRLWWVSAGSRLMAIAIGKADSQAFQSSWQVNDLPGTPLRLHRDQRCIGMLLASNGQVEYWRYDNSDLMLRQRGQLKSASPLQHGSIHQWGWHRHAVPDEDGSWILLTERLGSDPHTHALKINEQPWLPKGAITAVLASQKTTLLISQSEPKAEVVIANEVGQVVWRLAIDNAEVINARLDDSDWVLCTSDGRLCSINIDNGDMSSQLYRL